MMTIRWAAGLGLIAVALLGAGWTVAALPNQPPEGRIASCVGGLVFPCLFFAVGLWLLLSEARRPRNRDEGLSPPPEDEEPYDPFARRH